MGIRLHDDTYELRWSHEFRVLDFRDQESALDFLRRSGRSARDMIALRHLLARQGSHYQLSRLSDEQVLRQVASAISSGHLRVIFSPDRWHGSAAVPEEAEPAPAEPPPRAQAAREPPLRPPDDPPVLPADLDGAAMADASQTAAQHGAGVCEVCTRSSAPGGG